MRHFVPIDGRIMEAEIRGTHWPTVVILPGMACPIDDWDPVMGALSHTCQVFAFNRAGCGDSGPNPLGPSVSHTVRDLDELLSTMEVQSPVILVGHSYGGLCVQRFAREYPDRVCGVVLVDSTSVDLHRLDSLNLATLDEQDRQWLDQCRQFSQMTFGEILQRNSTLLTDYETKLSADLQARITRFYSSPTLYETMAQEVANWYQCARETKESGPFPDIPLKVIARDMQRSIESLVGSGIPQPEAELFERTWHDLIVEQRRLSRFGELIVATGATHAVYEDRPDIVIRAVLELVELSRATTKSGGEPVE